MTRSPTAARRHIQFLVGADKDRCSFAAQSPPADISTLCSPLSVPRLLLFLGSSRSDARRLHSPPVLLAPAVVFARHPLRPSARLQSNPDLDITATYPSESPGVPHKRRRQSGIRSLTELSATGEFDLPFQMPQAVVSRVGEIARTVSSLWRKRCPIWLAQPCCG